MSDPGPPLEGPVRDLFFFQNPRLWVVWPYLPVIRHKPDEDDDVGVLYDFAHTSGRTGYRCTVILTNLFHVPDIEEELLALPKEVFDSFEEVRAAGWCVD
jgi:hypothetical protein